MKTTSGRASLRGDEGGEVLVHGRLRLTLVLVAVLLVVAGLRLLLLFCCEAGAEEESSFPTANECSSLNHNYLEIGFAGRNV